MSAKRFNVIIDQERCKGCGLCSRFCPVSILKIDTEKLNKKGYHPSSVIKMEKCLGCGNCAVVCPDAAITIQLLEGEEGGVNE